MPSLAPLTRLLALSLLAALPGLSIAAAWVHGLQLIAEPLDAVERGVAALRLALAQGLLRLAHLIAEFLQAGGDLLLGIC